MPKEKDLDVTTSAGEVRPPTPAAQPAAPAAAPAPEKPTPTLAQRAEAGDLLTLDELMEVTGNRIEALPTASLGGPPVRGFRPSPAHACAVIAHGWGEHSKHTAEPLRMTRAVYVAALDSAFNGRGAHAPALSPYASKVHQDEPARVLKQEARK